MNTRTLILTLIILCFTAAVSRAEHCGAAVLIAGRGDAASDAALTKLTTDLTRRYHLLRVDFDGQDDSAIAGLAQAKLVIIAATPADWPVPLCDALTAAMNKAVSLVILDGGLAARSGGAASAQQTWSRLALVQGCLKEAPAAAALFTTQKKEASPPALRGVDKTALAALSAVVPPRDQLTTLNADEAGRTRAWQSAYYVPAPLDRHGNVAVIPLSSSAALGSPELRRFVLQAGLTVTGDSDLIPAAGLTVTP